MRLRGLKTIRLSARWLSSRIYGKALILGYHRVFDVTYDPYELCITPRYFAEQMAIVRRYANPLHLSDLVECLRTDNLPPRAVAVTFDDGYVDNLVYALPILEREAIPATIFVTTGYIGQSPWWEQLAQIVQVATHLSLNLDGQVSQWQFADQNDGYREQVLAHLYSLLLPVTTDMRNQILLDLSAQVDNLTENSPRLVNEAELCQLGNSPLIEIGAHTVTHPRLIDLTPDTQRTEVEGSKQTLEQLLGRVVNGFSYPHGALSADTLRIVNQAGFTYACNSRNDVVRQYVENKLLPRFWVPNVDGNQFGSWLRHWLT